jgi:hypothetical protein
MPHETAAHRKPATLRAEIDDRCSLRSRRRKTPPQLRKFIGAVFEAPNNGGTVRGPDVVAGFEIGGRDRPSHRDAGLAEGREIITVWDVVSVVVAHPGITTSAARSAQTPTLVDRPGPRRLQPDNRAPNPQPHPPAFHVAAVQHEVEQATGLDDGIASVALNQEIGRSIDLDLGDGSTSHARISAARS